MNANGGNEMKMNTRSVEFWIKVWGVCVILDGLLFIPLHYMFPDWFGLPWENVILRVAYGAALICGKRTYGMRMITLLFSFLWLGAGLTLVFYFTAVRPFLFPFVYHLIVSLFYLSLFIFLLTPSVKELYGPSPVPKTPPPALTSQEQWRIKFWVRVVAVTLVVESLIGVIFSHWYESHGLPNEGRLAVVFYGIASLGLLFFNQNIGRRFGLFVCLGGFIGWITSNFSKSIFGFWGHFYTIAIILFFSASFLFLFHPKTKAVFK